MCRLLSGMLLLLLCDLVSPQHCGCYRFIFFVVLYYSLVDVGLIKLFHLWKYGVRVVVVGKKER